MEEGTWKKTDDIRSTHYFGFIALGHDHWESSWLVSILCTIFLKISDAAHISSSLEMIMAHPLQLCHYLITSIEYHPKKEVEWLVVQF